MFRPLPAAKWNWAAASHLLNRAGFGAPPAAIQQLEAEGLEDAVSSLIDYETVPDPIPPPAWAQPEPDRLKQLQELRRTGPEGRRAAQKQEQNLQQQRITQLRGWWLNRMAQSARPLQEKLTLFWHGHFATSMQKVRDAYYMWLQNETFRRHASGSWLDLLVAVSKDPAMLIWMDQAQSRRHNPNENFAREVMELFALGPGHFTEADVHNAARAFTGLGLDRPRQVGVFRAQAHDPGIKTVLGRQGRLTWADVLEQIVRQPQAAPFIMAKLWRFFVSDQPPPEKIAALAEIFRRAGSHFKPVLRTLFLSEEFYAADVVRQQVKSPVQWLVGSVRVLEREMPPAELAARMVANLGQELFAPPNAQGWEQGPAWITTSTLFARYNQAAWLVYGKQSSQSKPKKRPGPAAQTKSSPPPVKARKLLTQEERSQKDKLLAALGKRLFHAPPTPRQQIVLEEFLDGQGQLEDQDILETIRLLMSTPAYQLT